MSMLITLETEDMLPEASHNNPKAYKMNIQAKNTPNTETLLESQKSGLTSKLFMHSGDDPMYGRINISPGTFLSRSPRLRAFTKLSVFKNPGKLPESSYEANSSTPLWDRSLLHIKLDSSSSLILTWSFSSKSHMEDSPD
jgi:hypothetical protein